MRSLTPLTLPLIRAPPRPRSPPRRRAGSAATPMAEREWRPRSPNTSCRSRLAPSTTCGCSHEARRARDEAEHREHPLDVVEIADRGLQHAQRVQRAPARGVGAGLDGHVVAEPALVHDHAVVVARELARRAGPAAVDHHRVERIVRRVRARAARCRARRAARSRPSRATGPGTRARSRRPSGARRRTRGARARASARASRRRRPRARPSTRVAASIGNRKSSRPDSTSSARGAISAARSTCSI